MLVSELINKLQQCPQDIEVKLYDCHENKYYNITDITKITEDYGNTTSYISVEAWEG